jgi:hypothetical protein
MENKKSNSLCDDVRPSVRPSIFTELARVKAQVEFECFGKWEKKANGEYRTDRNGERVVVTDPIFEEVCLIIAEVNLINPDSPIKVSGSEMSAFIVQEVYGRLTNDHIKAVIHNFQQIFTPIYNKKAYLRTALYNSVFENSIGVANDLAQDGFSYLR